MTPLAAPLATFLFFSSLVAAQISAPICTVPSEWMSNSLSQNPCLVAAYLGGVCNSGTFTVHALIPGYPYQGPSGLDDTDLCKCNTVLYSLISACAICQRGEVISWSQFSFNCTTTWPPSSFPYSIPFGTRVPQWALIDITPANMWDQNKAFAVGDSPELAPGATPGPSGSTIPASRTTALASSSLFRESSSPVNPNPPTPKSSSNTAVIVGGAVGGVVAISLVIVIGLFLLRRRPDAPGTGAPPAAGISRPPMDETQRPLTMHEGYTTSSFPVTTGSSMPGTPLTPMSDPVIQDPNYPSTFPAYQGVPQTPVTPQGAVPSDNGTGNSLATMQTSMHDQGYHGLPIV